jgi:hypothetical protein
VDQHIDLWLSFNDDFHEFTNTLETGQVEMVNNKIGVSCFCDDFVCKIPIIAVWGGSTCMSYEKNDDEPHE